MNNKLVDNFVNKGAEILLNKHKDLSQTLSQQDADLTLKICTSSRCGEWVDIYELSELRDILNSSDILFRNYTRLHKNLTKPERTSLLKEIEAHIPNCDRCRTKVNNEKDFEKVLVAEAGSSELFLQMVGSALKYEMVGNGCDREVTAKSEEETEPERVSQNEGFKTVGSFAVAEGSI